MNGTLADSKGRRQWKNEPLVLFVEGYSDLTSWPMGYSGRTKYTFRYFHRWRG